VNNNESPVAGRLRYPLGSALFADYLAFTREEKHPYGRRDLGGHITHEFFHSYPLSLAAWPFLVYYLFVWTSTYNFAKITSCKK